MHRLLRIRLIKKAQDYYMSKPPIRFLVTMADAAAVPFALLLAYLLRYGDKVGPHLIQPTPWSALIVVAVGALVSWFGLYGFMSLDAFSTGWSLPATVSRLALGVVIQMGVVLALAYLARVYFSRLILSYFAIIFYVVALLVRVVIYRVLRSYHRVGKTRRVVIVGEGKVANELTRRIRRHPELLYEVVGLLNPWMQPGNGRANQSVTGTPELSSLDVLKVLEERGVQELMVCLDQPSATEVQHFLARCLGKGMRVSLVPQPYELYCSRARLVELEGVPLVALEGLPHSRAAAGVKRAIDLILGVPLSLLACPILAVSSLVLKLEGRNALRIELRGGRYGQPFRMYKLNVDRHAVDSTGFQRFLCRLSISELPQLLNVLTGKMSLVGPRPETLKRIGEYSEWQRQRLNMRPGMTGLAQVNGLREQHSSEEKTRYDLQYIVRWTPIFDLILLLQTVWTLFARLIASDDPPTAPLSESGPDASVFSRHVTQ
jgi:lipopolysaccharide/colanic/teichoic acid biosynthesis glycosyltransferase